MQLTKQILWSRDVIYQTLNTALSFKLIADPNAVNFLYGRHCRDLKLVSLLARVRTSGSLFQSNICNLFLPGI